MTFVWFVWRYNRCSKKENVKRYAWNVIYYVTKTVLIFSSTVNFRIYIALEIGYWSSTSAIKNNQSIKWGFGDSFGWERSTLWDWAKVEISLLTHFLQVVTLWWRLWSSLVGGGCGRRFHKGRCATYTSIHCIQENLSNNVKLPWPLSPTDIVHVAKGTALLHKSCWFFSSPWIVGFQEEDGMTSRYVRTGYNPWNAFAIFFKARGSPRLG